MLLNSMTLAETPAREGGNNNGTSRNWWDILRALAPIAGGAIVGGVLGGKRGSLVGSVGMAKALESYTEQKRAAELAKQEAERKQREADIAQQKADTEARKADEAERKNREQEAAERAKEERGAKEKKAERAEKARLEHGYDIEAGRNLPESEYSPKLRSSLVESAAKAVESGARTKYYEAGAKQRLTPKPAKLRNSSEYRMAIQQAERRLEELEIEDDTPVNRAEIAELNEDVENWSTELRNLLGGEKKPEQAPPKPIATERPKPTAATLGTSIALRSAPPLPMATPVVAPTPTLALIPTPTPTPTLTPTPTGIQSLAPVPTRTPTPVPVPSPVPSPTAQAQPDTITGSDFDALIQKKLSENPSLPRDKVESALMRLLQERGIRLVR